MDMEEGGRKCRERELEGEKVGKEGVIHHVPFLTICHVMLLSCVVYYCIVTMIGTLKAV